MNPLILPQTYRLLARGMHGRVADIRRVPPLGLSDAQWQALLSATWRPGHGLALGFGDGCKLPDSLLLENGARLPIAAGRCEPGRLHAWIQARNASSTALQGTLAGLLRDPNGNRLYALSAGHVLAASAATRQGDRILIEESSTGRGVNAQLEHWTPSLFGGRVDTRVDAGLARIGREQAQDLLEYGLQLPTGIGEIRPGATLWLQKQGTAVRLTVRSYTTAVLRLDGDDNEIRLIDGLAYQADTPPIERDSGAPLWDARGRLAAMHVGGNLSGGAGNGIAIRIDDILRWCKCTLVERDTPLLDRDAPLPIPASTAPATTTTTTLVQSVPAQVLTLAQTLWGEARGEGRAGMEAVACVVMNRVRRQTYWGKTVIDVCRKPYQFSCWNPKDTNRRELQRLSAGSPRLAEALDIAKRAVGNALPDTTRGATHYHARSVLPRWARGHATSAVIGRHLFYNDIQ